MNPEQCIAPTTTVLSNTIITIAWTKPLFDGGSANTSYIVKIQQSDGFSFSLDLTDCNGSNAANYLAKNCTIPIPTLQSNPFNLVWGTMIKAKVMATNVFGSSLLDSPSGGDAVITTNPDAPVKLAIDYAITTNAFLGLKWENGASDGGTAVKDYRISWDQGSNDFKVLAESVTS
jgi:hypothetical protein